MLTRDILARLWPHAPAHKIDGILSVADDVLRRYSINTPLRLAHFMAQISHENGAGTIARENMNYSAGRLMEVFGQGHHSASVTPAEAARLAHRPEYIAERVYGLGNPKKAHELGNTRPGDGWRFRGGGDLQATGGRTYQWLTGICGVDLYVDPDKIADPAIAFRTAAAEFQALNCLSAADRDDVVLVTRRVNGGRNGLAERKAWLRRWKVALPQFSDKDPEPDEPAQAPRHAPPEPPPKRMASSTIGNAQIGTAAAGTATVGATIAEKVSEAPAVSPPVTDQIGALIDKTAPAIDLGAKVAEHAADVAPLWKTALHFATEPLVLGFGLTVIVALCAWAWIERRRHLTEDHV